MGRYCFAHFAAPPQLDDNIIYTVDPVRAADVYGLGKYEKNERILGVSKQLVNLYQQNRWYYASNMVGSLIEDFIKNIK